MFYVCLFILASTISINIASASSGEIQLNSFLGSLIFRKELVLEGETATYDLGENSSRLVFSFWLSPVDWKGNDKDARKFLKIQSEDTRVEFGKLSGTQGRENWSGTYTGKGYLNVYITNPSRNYSTNWYLGKWSPGEKDIPACRGNLDLSKFPQKEYDK